MANDDDAAQKLRESILTAVEPYKKTTEEPRFLLAEILTVAVVCCQEDRARPQPRISGVAIMNWIDDKFGHWSRYIRLLQSYETPVCMNDELGVSNILDASWKVRVPDNQVFLRRALGGQPQTRFPFLKLPTELRNRIYELVLSFPASGVMAVNSNNNNTNSRRKPYANAFWTRTKDSCTAPFSIDVWTMEHNNDKMTDIYASCSISDKHQSFLSFNELGSHYQSCESKLALLLTNKEIYAEAMPFFYDSNTFMFLSVSHLELKLRIMPAERRKHLRSVAFSYCPPDTSVAVSAFRVLAAIPKLHAIHVDVDEASWTRTEKLQDPANELVNIARLDILVDLVCSLQEVTFSSRCPIIAAHLKAKMRAAQKTAEVNETDEAKGLEADDATAVEEGAAA